MKLLHKLTLSNLLFKLGFVAIFIAVTPWLSERINLYQTDNELIEKRERIIDIIAEIGVDPFIIREAYDFFASYNILKEEFISLELVELDEYWNFIEVTQRNIDEEVIDYRVLNYAFLVDGEMYLLEIGKSLSSISITERNIRRVTIFFLLVFLIISVVFELLYTGVLLQPLNKITTKIKSTSDPAGFDHKPVTTSSTDFLMLDHTLSELMNKINQLIQKEREITQNISHELLTPISILRTKLENILTRDDLNQEITEKTEESLTTLHRLKTLVNSLLLIARIESNQYLKTDSFNISEVLNEVVEELQPLAEEAGIATNVLYQHDYHFTSANKSLLFSMFFNVINNAIKHTPAGGKIDVIASIENEESKVVIADTGEGITPEFLPDVFMRFKKKGIKDDSGTGIGLAIAKSIADYHKIKIEVSSELNKGTRLVFRLK
jgi:signal transduction histidine kinase